MDSLYYLAISIFAYLLATNQRLLLYGLMPILVLSKETSIVLLFCLLGDKNRFPRVRLLSISLSIASFYIFRNMISNLYIETGLENRAIHEIVLNYAAMVPSRINDLATFRSFMILPMVFIF